MSFDVDMDEFVALQKEVLRLREALEMVARAHHSTVEPSKLHHPEEVRFDRCQAKTCQLARAALRPSEKDSDPFSGEPGTSSSAGGSWGHR